MRPRVNFKSGQPVYLQVMEQVKSAAASGALRPGEALPLLCTGRHPRSPSEPRCGAEIPTRSGLATRH
jgi:hypothetical protein